MLIWLIPITISHHPYAQSDVEQEHEDDDAQILLVAQFYREIFEVGEILALPFLLYDRFYVGCKGAEVETVRRKPVAALY